jgi:hypothetical protein
MRIRRVLSFVAAASTTGGLLLGAVGTANAATGGAVKVFDTPTGNGTSALAITGAIGDYGKAVNIDKDGKVDPNGTFAKITLHKGTFEVNLAAFAAQGSKAHFPITKTCSSEGSFSAPVTLLHGTGLYRGISGTVKLTETQVFILPRLTTGEDKGRCNGQSPVYTYGSITGSGTVSY